VLGSRLKIT
jgi:hypothetical protein